MANEVTCRFCGKKLKKEYAYAVKRGKVNRYYCSFEHSIAKSPRDIFYELAFEIFGRTTNTVFYKEMDEIAKVHTFEKMTAYLKENSQFLSNTMRKEFKNEYNRCRYFSAILKNNLGDFSIPKPEIKKEVEVEVYENKYKPKQKSRKGMNSLMDELLD